MEKVFGDKKITIREFENKDFKNVKRFLEFYNSFNENDKLTRLEKLTIKTGKEYLNSLQKSQKEKTGVYILAEYGGKIIGKIDIDLMHGSKENHVGNLGIRIKDGYRGIGLGKFLMAEIEKLAIKKLKPSPKCIRLETFPNHIPALNLYKKMGFKIYGRIPKQREYKGKLYDEIIMLKFIK